METVERDVVERDHVTRWKARREPPEQGRRPVHGPYPGHTGRVVYSTRTRRGPERKKWPTLFSIRKNNTRENSFIYRKIFGPSYNVIVEGTVEERVVTNVPSFCVSRKCRLYCLRKTVVITDEGWVVDSQ